jgi:intracellular sulfur oxidation DsrE/DsrF family protein
MLHGTHPFETWLDGLNGRHRQFFDVGAMNNGAPLRRIHQYVDSYTRAYALADQDVSTLFGAHGNGLPFVLADAIWERFELGKRHGVIDPTTSRPATRNVFLAPDASTRRGLVALEASITRLQARGVRFLACNNTIDAWAQELSRGDKAREAGVRKELIDGLIPGAMLVPAMLVAGNRAQEVGFAYAFLA